MQGTSTLSFISFVCWAIYIYYLVWKLCSLSISWMKGQILFFPIWHNNISAMSYTVDHVTVTIKQPKPIHRTKLTHFGSRKKKRIVYKWQIWGREKLKEWVKEVWRRREKLWVIGLAVWDWNCCEIHCCATDRKWDVERNKSNCEAWRIRDADVTGSCVCVCVCVCMYYSSRTYKSRIIPKCKKENICMLKNVYLRALRLLEIIYED